MHLLAAIGKSSAAEIDPSRPLRLGPFELGIEATAEAIRIVSSGDISYEVNLRSAPLSQPIYWAIFHQTDGEAEIFGFPKDIETNLTTAMEIALVRTVAASPVEMHATILGGGHEIAIGSLQACTDFLKITAVACRPLAGESLLYGGSTQAMIKNDTANRLNRVALNCLANSLRTSPLKFRFLELYRMMEARFLADIKTKLMAAFDAEPGAALAEATDALKSEMNQLLGLAEQKQEAFEACWTVLHGMKNSNQFVTALFRRVAEKGQNASGKWRTGAALIYQIRCAVVHAGEKDMIFENFPDGEPAIDAVLPYVERAALLLVGIELA